MFIAELKKFFQPLLWLVALLIGLVAYSTDLYVIPTVWPSDGLRPIYDYAHEWQNQFGPTLDKNDMVQTEEAYQLLVKEVDALVTNHSFGQENGLKSFDDLLLWRTQHIPDVPYDELTQVEKNQLSLYINVYDSLINDKGIALPDKIEAYRDIRTSFERLQSEETFFKELPISDKDKLKLAPVLYGKNQGWQNILPPGLSSSLSAYFERVLLLVILLLSLLIPAILVRDRMLKIQKNQWSSHLGRQIVWTQFKAAMMASFVLTTVIVSIFVYLIVLPDYSAFFKNGLNSFFSLVFLDDSLAFSLFNWRFNQWLLMLISLLYLVAMGYSSVLFFISQTSDHYLSLLMKLVPIAFLFIFITTQLIHNAFYLNNSIYQLTNMPMSELCVAIIVFLLCLVIGMFPCIRSRTQELFN